MLVTFAHASATITIVVLLENLVVANNMQAYRNNTALDIMRKAINTLSSEEKRKQPFLT